MNSLVVRDNTEKYRTLEDNPNLVNIYASNRRLLPSANIRLVLNRTVDGKSSITFYSQTKSSPRGVEELLKYINQNLTNTRNAFDC